MSPSNPFEPKRITLRPITSHNFLECINLELAPGQETWIASNLYSIAQAKVEPCRKSYAIYAGEELVGFVMYNDEPLEDGTYRLSRLMIDRRHQGKGYGRIVTLEIINRLKQVPECREITLDYVPENLAAAHLYRSLGFETVEGTEHEIVAKLRL